MSDLTSTVDPWIIAAAIAAGIGAIAAVTTLSWDIIRATRRVIIKVSPMPAIVVINNRDRPIRVQRILCTQSDGNMVNLTNCAFFKSTIVPANGSHHFQLDAEALKLLKGKSIRFAFIEDADGDFYQGRIPRAVRRILTE